jgi:hypothetical protein
MLEICERIFEKLGPEKETAIEFFAVFSRFECALKCNECIKRKNNDVRAEPNWDDYAKYFEKPEKKDIKKKIEEAAKIYLWKEPPEKQIVENGKIKWVTAPTNEKSTISNTFDLIKIVRNNLFHGGKYEFGQDALFTKRRDEDLVQACLKILYICLTDENLVTEAFFNGLEINSGKEDNRSKKTTQN